MRRCFSILTLLVLCFAPASARASDPFGSVAFQHATAQRHVTVLHATQAVAVPLVVYHGDGVSSVHLIVAPLAAPVVVFPQATHHYGSLAAPVHRRHVSMLSSRCH